jgi:hypothetical protein
MIWGIVNSQPAQPGTSQEVVLPQLTRLDSNSNSSTSTSRGIAGALNTTSYLDVVKDFYWTYSKPESREEIPAIYLKEKRLKVNALVSQLKYSLGFAALEASQAVGTLTSFGSDLGLPDLFLDVASNVGGTVTRTAQTISDEISRLIEEDNNSTLRTSPWLQPYKGLYITEPTSWEFLFPYFDDKFETQGNQFSSEGVTNALAGIYQAAGGVAMEVAEIAGAINNPTNITYIERAKFFNFPTDGDEVSFSFPLINTGSVTYDDVVNNWQLLFLLLYNNKPGRKSPTQIEQPVIYEVEVPGVRFLPFCYIASIDIKFQGSRRELPINIPYSEQQIGTNSSGSAVNISSIGSFKTINTIIPDAYYVTITLKSMLGNTKNFMYHMIDKGDRTRVGVRNATPA